MARLTSKRIHDILQPYRRLNVNSDSGSDTRSQGVQDGIHTR
ncbi:Uncharacterised protein [Vibrio cholerae]|nr:Uncharacterised protein [Vibrio cholerae]